MNALNQVILEGNVTKDSMVRETPRGTKFAMLSMAVNRSYKDVKGDYQKEVAYFDVQAWGPKFSENIARKAKRGQGIRVVGRLKQDRWKNSDGKAFSKIYVVADTVEFKWAPKKDENKTSEDEFPEKSDYESTASEIENISEAATGLRNEINDEIGVTPEESEAVF